MEFISSEEFSAWAATHGIGRSREYPHSTSLLFPSAEGTWYRYRRADPAEPLLTGARRATEVAAAGTSVWLFPPGRNERSNGRWDRVAMTEDETDCPLRAAVREAGIPLDYVGAVRCAPSELAVAGALFAAALEDGGVLWTLSVIPEHARCILRSDEDEDLLGLFPTEGACWSYTEALRDAGWQEPTGPDPRVSETDPWLEILPPAPE